MPEEWLGLFPEGGEIGPGGFNVAGFGKKLKDGPTPEARVGDYTIDESGQAGDVLPGRVQPLDDFSLAVLQSSVHAKGEPVDLGVDLPAEFDDITYDTSMWPNTAVEPLNSPPCAQLDVDHDHVPFVALAGSPEGAAVSPPLDSDDQIPDDERRLSVDRGHGAFVMSGTWNQTESDATYVIDPLGKAYALVGGPITLEKLKYDKDDAPLVPDEWVGLFDVGVALSTSEALCPPATQPDEPRTPEDCQDPPS